MKTSKQELIMFTAQVNIATGEHENGDKSNQEEQQMMATLALVFAEPPAGTTDKYRERHKVLTENFCDKLVAGITEGKR